MRVRRLISLVALLAFLVPRGASAEDEGHARRERSAAPAERVSDQSEAPTEARIREAIGSYGFLCAGGLQLAVLVAFALGRSPRRRPR